MLRTLTPALKLRTLNPALSQGERELIPNEAAWLMKGKVQRARSKELRAKSEVRRTRPECDGRVTHIQDAGRGERGIR